MLIINAQNIGYTWPKSDTPALDIAGFQIEHGRALFLRGASGSGKSTLLGLLAGTLIVQSGSLQILDTELASLSPRNRDRFRANHIGIVFQKFNLIPFLTVEGNLRLAARFSEKPPRKIREKSEHLLAALNLDSAILQRRADRLSVGQQQRVAIARALINDPELLLADEPTSALDTDTRDTFMSLLMSIRDVSNCTMIFASHDRSLAKYFDIEIELSKLNRAQAEEASLV
ncbi:MAG TPA: hypothetical protein DEF79_10205 [Gammaproteobacteria bacterium]|nr:hypothetical protein [Gammaproteobacteria bacterium]|tara:strand:+ start:79 stop:768 length:690 start_codon:yes stop_codon:yes gene_type:complete